MQRVKRRIFSGVVCEQEVFNVSDRLTDIKKAEPRPRFKTEEALKIDFRLFPVACLSEITNGSARQGCEARRSRLTFTG